MTTTERFEPPPYPFDLLDDLHATASAAVGDGAVADLTIGSPVDPTPRVVVDAIAASTRTPGYPPSAGTSALRAAASRWMCRTLGVSPDPDAEVAACVGSKELIASTPQYLRLRSPQRDTVLHPTPSYPTYAMGARLAGARAVGYRSLTDIEPADAARALCLWVNSPGNPTGATADLAAAASWGRAHGVPVLSDECYVEFTWDGPPRTILEHGTDGVLAVHSLSKRSNFAGGRLGLYAGDADLVAFLREVRRHAGLVPSGPIQDAAVAALDDTAHVTEQRARYRRRLGLIVDLLRAAGLPAELPAGGFFVWAPVPDGDAWAAAGLLARQAGVVTSPGDLYGEAGRGWLRAAAVAPSSVLGAAVERLASTT